ncbi:hypothetical protein B0H10DRAFT_2020773 [Mycena sp. CBHHK59/15]|nr:hypothetical protein B0H10DRAFT_2020773 [Mycena sp. CBHHK59/15]
MSCSVLVDSTNALKRPAHFAASGRACKKQCSDTRKPRCQEGDTSEPQTPGCELENILRRLARSADPAAARALKGIVTGPGGERVPHIIFMVQSIIERVKEKVAETNEGRGKMLQAELYLEWLKGYDFVLTAVENVLSAKLQITTGKSLFAILFHLIDEYISAVDAHQDGWSHRFPMGPVEPYSWVMTLVEEANDSSTDERSTAAVKQAEAKLDQFDQAMARALLRYKSECDEYWQIAAGIGRKQETLARGCCLLSEQTGYGDADDMGFGLLATTREAMLEWKGQCTSASESDDSGYESN